VVGMNASFPGELVGDIEERTQTFLGQ
jgi:hypothetical protein